MKNILFFLLVAFLCIQCKNECLNENIKLGDISFNEITLDYIDIYENVETVSFISQFGDIRVHEVQKLEDTNQTLCVKVLCRPSYELEGLNGCEFYDADGRSYTLTSDDVTIQIDAGISLITPETENYYDYFNVSLTSIDTTVSAGLITAANFTNPLNINVSVLTNYLEGKNISENIDLTKFLEYEEDSFFIIYRINEGIIKYKLDGLIWTLME